MYSDNYYCRTTLEELNQINSRYMNKEFFDYNNKEEELGKKTSEVVIDETTIYEIDLNCYDCIKKRMNQNR